MAATRRNGPAPLIEELFARPGSFDFFQAVRLLEIAAKANSGAHGVGEDNLPAEECVRFHTRPALAFASSEILGLSRPDQGGAAAEMDISFLGFVGTAGVLPQQYTELTIERLQLRDSTLRDWFDLFSHRAVSLFYRAHSKYRFPFASEREAREHQRDDQFTRALYSLVGLGQPALRGRMAIDDSSAVFEGGHAARKVRSSIPLAQLLSDLFGAPVRIEEFVGRWLAIPDDERCMLPAGYRRGDQRVCLGRGATLGARVWDVQSRIRIHIGPLSFGEYESLRPGGSQYEALQSAIGFYVGLDLEYGLQLHLAPHESPGTRLADRGADPISRLGLNTWLESKLPVSGARVADLTGGQASERQR